MTKKIPSFFLLIGIAIALLSTPSPADAATTTATTILTCDWKLQTTITSGGSYTTNNTKTGGCTQEDLNKCKNKCTGTQPEGEYNLGSYTEYVCCPRDAKEAISGITVDTPDFNLLPKLQIKIPGLQDFIKPSCKQISGTEMYCYVDWLGKYIVGIYEYGLAIGGILAAIVLMAGGVIWLVSAGDASRITQAKNLIGGSVIGLIILTGAYLILNQINPNLTTFKSLKIMVITPEISDETMTSYDWVFDPGIIKQVNDASPQLNALFNCMRQKITDKKIGRISSISDSKHIGKLADCNSKGCQSNECVHVCQSCHYGGGTQSGKSYAVDFGDEQNMAILEKAAKECDPNAYVLNEENHVHISVSECPKK